MVEFILGYGTAHRSSMSPYQSPKVAWRQKLFETAYSRMLVETLTLTPKDYFFPAR
jgi:hypothetical protein